MKHSVDQRERSHQKLPYALFKVESFVAVEADCNPKLEDLMIQDSRLQRHVNRRDDLAVAVDMHFPITIEIRPETEMKRVWNTTRSLRVHERIHFRRRYYH